MSKTLKELWEIQYNFNKLFLKDKKNLEIDNLTIEQKNELSKEFILHGIKEYAEVLDEIKFKMHRSYRNVDNNIDNIIEELIDIQKYLWGLFQVWGVDVQKFSEEFIRKSEVVLNRYNQEFINIFDKNKKIIIFDIDGVVADYPQCFIDFVNKKNNTNYKSMFDVKDNILQQDIYKLKDEYRKSGVKRFLPLKNETIDFINKYKNEFYIILLSSRPYHKYYRIYADTIEWLKNNKIHYDAIYWDEKKDRNILKNFNLQQIEFMIEDNLYFSNKISQIGVKVFLLNNEYNQGHCLQNVKRINSIKEIFNEHR